VFIMNALYAENTVYQKVRSKVAGIKHPYLNIGRIEGGTNTNVIPGKVVLKLDRRMIPEEDPAKVEARIRKVIEGATRHFNRWRGVKGEDAVRTDVRRMLLANAMTRCPATSRWWTPSSATPRPCSAPSRPPWARRCTPTCACTWSAAFPA
jgi:acetylornithine deacetylase/succinyl-diaminopimelate desuccinylase-like protein